jgi:hypothetical protein
MLSALRAMCVNTCPRVHFGKAIGADMSASAQRCPSKSATIADVDARMAASRVDRSADVTVAMLP